MCKKLSQKNLRGVLLTKEKLSSHTSWEIGGVADYFYIPVDIEDLASLMKQLPKTMQITFLGTGSNVLISDAGLRGIVICTKIKNVVDTHSQTKFKKIQEVSIDTSSVFIKIYAGTLLSQLVHYGLVNGISAIAAFSGIPGTVGGALITNAGAYGNEIWNYVSSVEIIDRKGNIKLKKRESFNISYRNMSGLQENEEWIISCNMCFNKDSYPNNVRQVIKSLIEKRMKSQPACRDQPNCGSVFKNPKGMYAAKLIEDCGLKGLTVGGVKISEKHANFIINYNRQATSTDITKLISKIKSAVHAKFGIVLQEEVKVLD